MPYRKGECILNDEYIMKLKTAFNHIKEAEKLIDEFEIHVPDPSITIVQNSFDELKSALDYMACQFGIEVR